MIDVLPPAHECHVRDRFAHALDRERPRELLLKREQRYDGSRLRADLRTIGDDDVLREWEFKIHADYVALGQILTYVALARREEGFRPIRGVIAAFTFSPELPVAIEVMNLGIELVTLPAWLWRAGKVPTPALAPAVLSVIPPDLALRPARPSPGPAVVSPSPARIV